MYKPFGISFFGGLAKSFASIGAIKFFQEEGLEPQVLRGASGGAILAAMWAYGMTSDEMLDALSHVKFNSLIDPKKVLKNKSLVDAERFLEAIIVVTRGQDLQIEDLPTKLIIAATDPRLKQQVAIKEGSLARALMVSSSMPWIFPQVDKELIDGNMIKDFGVGDLQKEGAAVTIGVKPMPRIGGGMGERLQRRGIDFIKRRHGEVVDGFVSPDLTLNFETNISYTDLSGIRKVAEHAYEQAYAQREQILSVLS
jgi:predicted acylesterase/phospholipase RssA